MKKVIGALKRILFAVLLLMIALTAPFTIYGSNGRYDLIAILLRISYDSAGGGISFRFIPDSIYIQPALLLCLPCFLWLLIERDLRFPILLASSGAVLFLLTMILLLFLPISSVFPWLFPSFLAAIAVIPKFINLVPFAGLTFAIMVLLPLLRRVFIYPVSSGVGIGKKVSAGISSVSALLLPLTLEISHWRGTDFIMSYSDGYAFNSVTWFLSHSVDGNLWGHGTWFSFSVSSIYASLLYLLPILPGIVFLWFACRSPTERRAIVAMIAAGLIHILVASLICIWLNNTVSHPGSWSIYPLPTLLIVGFLIFLAPIAHRWIRARHSMKGSIVQEREPVTPRLQSHLLS